MRIVKRLGEKDELSTIERDSTRRVKSGEVVVKQARFERMSHVASTRAVLM